MSTAKAGSSAATPNMPLLWFIRDQLNLTGTKFGCGAGVCGACTVHVDGVAVRSCQTTVGEAAGKTVTTIEGLSPDGNHPVQQAWRKLSVPQCGFCQAGQIMQAASLLSKNRAPTDEQIVEEMQGNICRCGCYQRIHRGRSSRRRRSMIMLQYFEDETFNVRRPRGDVVLENVSRRSILGGILTGTGLVLSARFSPASAREALKLYPTGADDMPNKWVDDPKVFVAIDPDGTVTIVAHRAEMGTGIRTSLPAVVADEMEADWSRVRLSQAPGDEPRYGNQDTDGSRSMRHFIQAMRTCGAAMRQMLESAAAIKWNVDAPLCRAKNHRVYLLDQNNKETGKSLGFGELAALAMTLPVPAQQTLLYKTPDEFTLIGKGKFQIADLHDITTGKAHYGADTRLPGMKFAVMARPAVLGGKLKKYDASKTLKVPGVEAVYEIDGVFTVPRGIRHFGRRRRRRQFDLRRNPGPRRARRRMGRRPERQLQFRGVRQGDDGNRRAAGQGHPQSGRSGRGLRERKAGLLRRIPCPAYGPGANGAARCHRAHRRRQGRGVGTGAKPLRRPQRYRDET